ncbi:unnamed protein product [Scytosiphon promiscuus]
MFCNSLRASARVGGRRALPLLVTSTGHRPAASAFRRCFIHSSRGVREINMTTSSSSVFLSKDSNDRADSSGRGSGDRGDRKMQFQDTPRTTSTTTTTSGTRAAPEQEQTLAERWNAARSKVSGEYLKRFMKKYGRVAVAFHLSVFFTTLGTCYSLVDYGGLDMAVLVKDIPILADNLPPASAGNLAIAYGMTSAIGPPRAILTVTLTPRIAKFLEGREAKRRETAEEKQ